MDYVYLAQNRQGIPLRATIRKYELKHWLQRQSEDMAKTFMLWRLGGRQGPVQVDLAYFGL